jgi:hypothetical protein
LPPCVGGGKNFTPAARSVHSDAARPSPALDRHRGVRLFKSMLCVAGLMLSNLASTPAAADETQETPPVQGVSDAQLEPAPVVESDTGAALSSEPAASSEAEPFEYQPYDPDEIPDPNPIGRSGKLLLTAGVSQLEGAAGGGLVPWAVIGSYATQRQIGASAFYTQVELGDYGLRSYGALLGLYDRVELSFAQQRFDTQRTGIALGLGEGFAIGQQVFGAKIRLFGDAVLDQDSWLPQLAFGVQHKQNDREELLAAIGARSDSGTDYYLSATKLLLGRGLLLNGTLRFTEANQFGLLGFGGDRHAGHRPQLEISAASLLSRSVAVGAEYRSKPDNLGLAHEDDAWDVFLVWAPARHATLTVAWVELGDILIADRQHGLYASLQLGF